MPAPRNREGREGIVKPAMRIRVVAEKCEGHNRCHALAPDLFEVDDLRLATARRSGIVPPGLVMTA